MRVVQTELSEAEHGLLEAYVKSRGTTIKEAVREAVRKMTLRDQVDPEDPVFRAFPLTKKPGKLRNAAEEHDRHLYGSAP